MNKTIKMSLTFIIIFLFVILVITPPITGTPKNEDKNVINRVHGFSDFNKYNLSEIYSDGYKQKRSRPLENTAETKFDITKEEMSSIRPLNSPMNSPWPMYCHDTRHTGRSSYSTADTWDEKWRFKQHKNDFIRGSPVISDDGTIYFGGLGDFYALYSNGTMKWKYDDLSFYVWSAPAIDECGVIYVGDRDGYFYAIDPDGKLKWKYCAGDDILSSPAVGADSTIYFGDETKHINALWPNGTVRWRYETGHVVYSSPAIGDDGTVYCGSHDTYLYALYPNNGTLKWKYKTGDWIRTSPCIADDGTIYVVSLDNYLYAVNPNGSLKWKTNMGEAGTSPTIAQDGTIYAGYTKLHAINPTNGSVKWTLDASGKIKGATPCNSVDGFIYFGTEIGDYGGGDIVAVNPDGTERWRKRIANMYVDSAPAIGEDGTIYIGSAWNENGYSRGYLHAFGPGEPKKVEIQQPQPGKLYLFGKEIGSTQRNNTVILGSTKITVHAYSEDQIENMYCYVDGQNLGNLSKPPFEWRMNHRYGKWPLMKHTITVTAYYKGGCTWTESLPVLYFHLRKNS